MSGLPRPQIRFRVALLQHPLRSREVPSAERQLALVLFLHGRFAVPGDALPRIDGAAQEAVFVGAPEAELGEFVAEVGGLGEELLRVSLVLYDGVVGLG